MYKILVIFRNVITGEEKNIRVHKNTIRLEKLQNLPVD